MEPLSLWERIKWVIWTPYVWTQCKHDDGNGWACLRRKFHFGDHRYGHLGKGPIV